VLGDTPAADPLPFIFSLPLHASNFPRWLPATAAKAEVEATGGQEEFTGSVAAAGHTADRVNRTMAVLAPVVETGEMAVAAGTAAAVRADPRSECFVRTVQHHNSRRSPLPSVPGAWGETRLEIRERMGWTQRCIRERRS
jgi:hypothetical protein